MANSSYNQNYVPRDQDTPEPGTQETPLEDNDQSMMFAMDMAPFQSYEDDFRYSLPAATPGQIYENIQHDFQASSNVFNTDIRDRQAPFHTRNVTPSQLNPDIRYQELPRQAESHDYDQNPISRSTSEMDLAGHTESGSWSVHSIPLELRLNHLEGTFHERLTSIRSKSHENHYQQGEWNWIPPHDNATTNQGDNLIDAKMSFGYENDAFKERSTILPKAIGGDALDPSVSGSIAGRANGLPFTPAGQASQEMYWSASESSNVGYSQAYTPSRPSPMLNEIGEAPAMSQVTYPSHLKQGTNASEDYISFDGTGSSSPGHSNHFRESNPRRISGQNVPVPLFANSYKKQTVVKTPSHSDSTPFSTSCGNRPYGDWVRPQDPAQYALPPVGPQWLNFNENVPDLSVQRDFYPNENPHGNETVISRVNDTASQCYRPLETPIPGHNINFNADSPGQIRDPNCLSDPDVHTFSFGQGKPAVRFHIVIWLSSFVRELILYIASTRIWNFRRLDIIQPCTSLIIQMWVSVM